MPGKFQHLKPLVGISPGVRAIDSGGAPNPDQGLFCFRPLRPLDRGSIGSFATLDFGPRTEEASHDSAGFCGFFEPHRKAMLCRTSLKDLAPKGKALRRKEKTMKKNTTFMLAGPVWIQTPQGSLDMTSFADVLLIPASEHSKETVTFGGKYYDHIRTIQNDGSQAYRDMLDALILGGFIPKPDGWIEPVQVERMLGTKN